MADIVGYEGDGGDDARRGRRRVTRPAWQVRNMSSIPQRTAVGGVPRGEEEPWACTLDGYTMLKRRSLLFVQFGACALVKATTGLQDVPLLLVHDIVQSFSPCVDLALAGAEHVVFQE